MNLPGILVLPGLLLHEDELQALISQQYWSLVPIMQRVMSSCSLICSRDSTVPEANTEAQTSPKSSQPTGLWTGAVYAC